MENNIKLENIKPCPFCGSESVLNHIKYTNGDISFHVECSRCTLKTIAIKTGKGIKINPIEAISQVVDYWNCRTEEPKLEKKACVVAVRRLRHE